ncbi:hypothetical protein BDR06DRAFT_128620 [Suillus hirtellus]|nr:hypothetical protein BDR06DRAFT_128620 [Suillus hirtellus]
MMVISNLLSSPSSPSNQIVANCTLLACVMVGIQFEKKVIVRIDKSSALPQFADALLAKFQKALWACNRGDLSEDSTNVARRVWNLLKVICLMLEPVTHHYRHPFHVMQNLDVCRKIYSRMQSLEQSHPWELLDGLQNALRFTLAAAKVSRDPAHSWNNQYLGIGDSHSPEDLDWLIDYFNYTYSYNQEGAFDVLVLLGVMKVRCRPDKQHQFFESLIGYMGSDIPVHLRHAALRLAYSAQEEMVVLIDDARLWHMISTEFFPAILTAVCPQPCGTLSDDGPDCFFHYDRDLCYLKLIFTLASNRYLHLCWDSHTDRCIQIIAECCESHMPHAFYLAGIFLLIAPEQLSDTPLDSITEQQWWDMISVAWLHADDIVDEKHCFEFLPVLVHGTKNYMHIAPENGENQSGERVSPPLL